MTHTKTCRRCDMTFHPEGSGNFNYCRPCRERTCAECGSTWKPLRPSSDETRCGACRHAAAMRAQRPPANYEYQNRSKWRKRVYDDHGGRCDECGSTQQLHAHHIIPRAIGGANTAENGILLCEACHAAEHTPLANGSLLDDLATKIANRVAEILSTQGHTCPPTSTPTPSKRSSASARTSA